MFLMILQKYVNGNKFQEIISNQTFQPIVNSIVKIKFIYLQF